jgi:hypothetical protein
MGARGPSAVLGEPDLSIQKPSLLILTLTSRQRLYSAPSRRHRAARLPKKPGRTKGGAAGANLLIARGEIH